ncbi:hypothetical protein AGMMS50289_06850 [Betaproteobacteria bacterium]|nr:hypothetical protein AGMMS50289_06850 [Betaproteobacteria bacterium]
MNLKRKRILAGVVSCVILAVTLLACMSLSFIGFPDGHLTELDKVKEAWLYPVFIGGSLVFAAWFAASGFVFYKNNLGKRLVIALCAYAIFAFLFVCMYLYLGQFFEDGEGICCMSFSDRLDRFLSGWGL